MNRSLDLLKLIEDFKQKIRRLILRMRGTPSNDPEYKRQLSDLLNEFWKLYKKLIEAEDKKGDGDADMMVSSRDLEEEFAKIVREIIEEVVRENQSGFPLPEPIINLSEMPTPKSIAELLKIINK
jgi:CHASE3 domain sensor protein